MWELILIALGLAADAFALSLCKGFTLPLVKAHHLLLSALYFGGFQALMPLFGYALGERFRHIIEAIDHWIAFALLICVGAGMFMESFQKDVPLSPSFSAKEMLPLALSASIDALAIGITFSIQRISIFPACILIGGITAGACAVGIRIGGLLGKKYNTAVQRAGGGILIFMGIRLLISHLL